MTPESNSNAPASERTSASEPKSPASESAFLTRQAADAKAAIARVADDIKADLARGVDPRAWMQVAPWTTLAGAAVAGFLAAAATVPSKEQQALRRLRRMEKALHIDADESVHDRKAVDEKAKASAGKTSTMGALMGSVMAAIQPLLMSAITGALGAQQSAPPAAPAAGNGSQPTGSAAATTGANTPNASDI